MNSKISCLDNMIMIITCGDVVFGMCMKGDIPIAKAYENQSIRSEYMRLMILEIDGEKKMIEIKRREGSNDKTLMMYNMNEKEFLVTCYSSFWITQELVLRIHPLIKQQYVIPGCITSSLSQRGFTEGVICSEILILHVK